MSLTRRKEHLTVGRTLEELQRQEPEVRAAGFKKRYGAHGRSPAGEFYQWWDRVGMAPASDITTRRSKGLCIKCGADAALSTRKGARGKSQFCLTHLIAHREYQRKHLGYKRRNPQASSYRGEPK